MSNPVVPQPKEQENVETGHSYDGIREYDNPLPGWWKNLFWASIVFSFCYVIYFHAGAEGRTIHDGYQQQMSAIFERRFSEIGVLEPNRETILEYMAKPQWVDFGETVYKTNCVSCHGAKGEGLVGPNLTDDFWKNVKNVEDIATVIAEGAASGSMPAWQNRMSHQNQIVLTAVYVASLRANPVPGKPPEGEKIPGWEE